MEWTENLMIDHARETVSMESESAKEFTRVVPLSGVTLLCANTTTRTETAAALKLLRGFRATGRRVVLCDTSQLVVGKQFGHEVVELGGAELLVSCGISGREVGIGARDAGLELSNVVVCGKPVAGSHVLFNQLVPGDTVLMLGLDEAAAEEVIKLLTSRLGLKPAMAA